MLIQLYPVSLDTYSTSSPFSKQRRNISHFNAADGCRGCSSVHPKCVRPEISLFVVPCQFSSPACLCSSHLYNVDFDGYPSRCITRYTDPVSANSASAVSSCSFVYMRTSSSRFVQESVRPPRSYVLKHRRRRM